MTTDEPLPPYDPDATCPKCGHEDVSTAYIGNGHHWNCKDHGAPPATFHGSRDCCADEHLHRTCQRCHYLWREEVQAAAQAEGAR